MNNSGKGHVLCLPQLDDQLSANEENAMKTLITMALALALIGCDSGSSLEGTYQDKFGMSEYTFNKDGTVVMSTFIGSAMEFDYEIEGDKVKMNTPEGRLVLTLLENGNLSGPGGELEKQ
jgi:hypothetical protein